MKQIREFAERHGLVADTQRMEAHVATFISEMERGLRGEDSSLMMIR